ncbi:PKD domain-containing protein, partial [Candidatus Altiarchaeota archaeon]
PDTCGSNCTHGCRYCNESVTLIMIQIGRFHVFLDDPVTFNGNLSFDRDENGSNITFYEWDFNDSNISANWMSNDVVEIHSFSEVNVYNVTLYVEDDDSNPAQNITVGNDSIWIIINVTDSCGLPCYDNNSLPDTCGSNCTHGCRYCNESGPSGVCELGDCERSCDAWNASAVCVLGCNKCDLDNSSDDFLTCIGDCTCPECELTTLSCPDEGFVGLNFTVNYTVFGAWIDDNIDAYNLLGMYYDEGDEQSCWNEEGEGCIYRNMSFNATCPFGGVGAAPAPVNFSLNCSGVLSENLTCENIILNPSLNWHSNLSCTVDCFDLRTNVTLYLNSTCTSNSESSLGYTPIVDCGNVCCVDTNATLGSQIFDYECLAGVGPSDNCSKIYGPTNCDTGCYYALEGNTTLIDVTGNGEYWWSVECNCDGNSGFSEENWTFTVDKEYGVV